MMKPPAVPAAAACPQTREANRGEGDDGQQFIAQGLSPVVLGALYMGSADAKINMIGAGTQKHRHKGKHRERKEKGSAGVEAYEKASKQSLNSIHAPLF